MGKLLELDLWLLRIRLNNSKFKGSVKDRRIDEGTSIVCGRGGVEYLGWIPSYSILLYLGYQLGAVVFSVTRPAWLMQLKLIYMKNACLLNFNCLVSLTRLPAHRRARIEKKMQAL